MLTAHLHCYYCNDSWFRELIDQAVQAYIEEHPALEKKILSGEITDIDLGEVLCDGCEDFFAEEEALAECEEHCDDLEDEIDRMADLMAHGRI